MPVGSVNLWETLSIYFMDKIGYDGWIAYDVFTEQEKEAMQYLILSRPWRI